MNEVTLEYQGTKCDFQLKSYIFPKQGGWLYMHTVYTHTHTYTCIQLFCVCNWGCGFTETFQESAT